MQFNIPLTKIDVERRLVIGVAAHEVEDKSREIMDYASARPQFEKWSQGFSDATNGLSKGNLRVMHTKHVAGKIDQIGFDDDNKRVEIVAKVVDDNDWAKVVSGAYTGFSIGGGYLKKWNDPALPGVTRYTPDIREISLVDSPCIPTARFAELVKADGLVEQIELVGHVPTFSEMWKSSPPVQTFAQAWDARPMTFAELGKAFWRKSSPAQSDADTQKHVELAHHYLGQYAQHVELADHHHAEFQKHAELANTHYGMLTFHAKKAGLPVVISGKRTATLGKRFDGTKHPREHDGQFASKNAEVGARFVTGGGGAIAGYAAGALHGAKIGGAIAHQGAKTFTALRNAVTAAPTDGIGVVRRALSDDDLENGAARMGRAVGGKYGNFVGAAIGGTAAALAGGSIGAKLDEIGRRRRAKKAGKLDQYERLNADVTVRPNSAKQLKRGAQTAMRHGRKIQAAHSFVRGITG